MHVKRRCEYGICVERVRNFTYVNLKRIHQRDIFVALVSNIDFFNTHK